MKSRVMLSTVVFCIFSLLGPLLAQAARSRELGLWIGGSIVGRQYLTILLLVWPTFFLESDFGAIVSNVLLFAIIGFGVGILAKGRTAILSMYLAMCALLGGLEALAGGFDLASFQWSAFCISCLLYALPFGVVLLQVLNRTGALHSLIVRKCGE